LLIARGLRGTVRGPASAPWWTLASTGERFRVGFGGAEIGEPAGNLRGTTAGLWRPGSRAPRGADSAGHLHPFTTGSATHRRPDPPSRPNEKRTEPARAQSSLGSGSGGLMRSRGEVPRYTPEALSAHSVIRNGGPWRPEIEANERHRAWGGGRGRRFGCTSTPWPSRSATRETSRPPWRPSAARCP